MTIALMSKTGRAFVVTWATAGAIAAGAGRMPASGTCATDDTGASAARPDVAGTATAASRANAAALSHRADQHPRTCIDPSPALVVRRRGRTGEDTVTNLILRGGSPPCSST